MTKRTILVTGANGFVGKALLKRMEQDSQFHIRAAIRTVKSAPIDSIEYAVVGDMASDTDWSAALNGVETIIHLAARVHVMNENALDPLEEFRITNVAGTEQLARSAAVHGVKRLVYVSSIKVNGEITDDERKFSEEDEPAPQDPYGRSKMEAEQALRCVERETGMEVVIVRPTLVYGFDVKGNFLKMMEVLAKELPLPLASVSNQRSLVYIENLVDALILCAIHPTASGGTYLVSDGEDVSTPGLLRALGKSMGRRARLFPFPISLLILVGRLFGKTAQIMRLVSSLRIDSGKIRRELGWRPPYTLQEGLRRTGKAYMASKNKDSND